MAESEEGLMSLLMQVKEESEKAGLQLNIQTTKIMASCCITSWQIEGEKVETVRDFIFLGSKITVDADCSHEIKRRFLLERYDRPSSVCAQSCPTLCESIDCTLLCSSARGIFWTRILEWSTVSYSRAPSWPMDQTCVSCTGRRILYHCKIWEAHGKPRQHVKNQRHHFANRGPYSQSSGFSSSYVQMCELDHKEGWALKSWCFWIVVLEKTLKSPLDKQGDQTSQS